MIPFNFSYCRPASLEEAVSAYRALHEEGKNPVYYGGGSEIITLCRAGSIRPGAVIDVKQIPTCQNLVKDGKMLRVGAACTLNQIKESKLFPLLGLCCGRIADHTNQCRITLGGNLNGSIIYRETSLPLLLSDAELTLFGPGGERTLPFREVFSGRLLLQPGELMVEAHIPDWALHARHAHIKRTTNEKIDYPLLSLAALWKEGVLRVAISGVCARPFRSKALEALLNDSSLSPAERAEGAAALLPEAPCADVEGSGKYRVFVLKNTLSTLLEDLEHGAL